MSARRSGSRVVGKKGKTIMRPRAFQIPVDRRDDLFVYKFYRTRLAASVALVPAFVGSFEVNVHIVVAFKSVYCGLGFALEVGVQVACCAFHVYARHARAERYALY